MKFLIAGHEVHADVCAEVLARDKRIAELEHIVQNTDLGIKIEANGQLKEQIERLAAELERARKRQHQSDLNYDALERSVEAKNQELEQARAELRHEREIVDRIWDIYGRPHYTDLNGKSLYDLIVQDKQRAESAEAKNAELQQTINHLQSGDREEDLLVMLRDAKERIQSLEIDVVDVNQLRAEAKAENASLVAQVVVIKNKIEIFPELNPNNYDEEDVRALNNWGIDLYRDAAKLPAEAEKLMRIADYLGYILPMAKGFAFEHDVGDNKAIVIEAEQAYRDLRGKK